MIKAIIVDDEPYCCEALSILLNRYCPQVEVAGMYHSGAQALEPIGSTGAEAAALLKSASERWRGVIKTSNIRLD